MSTAPGLLDQTRTCPRVEFDFTAYTPAAAEEITGATGTYQRELRKRGVLSHRDGHSRFDVFGLASLMLLRMHSERGGPGLAKGLAAFAGFGISWYALMYRDAYRGDVDRILSWDAELFPRIEAWQAATALLRGVSDWSEAEALAEVARVSASLDGFSGWMLQADWLRGEIFRRRQCTKLPIPRYACWWATGTYAWQDSVDAAFDVAGASDPRLCGPVVVIDQERLGQHLFVSTMQSTGRPFVTVTMEKDPQ